MTDALQKEAREAAERIILAPEVHYHMQECYLAAYQRADRLLAIQDGYLAAAEPREKEIASLRAQVADLTETVERLRWTLERPEERS